MHSSEVVEVAGVFVGVVLRTTDTSDFRFLATHAGVRDLHGCHADSTQQLRAKARALFSRRSNAMTRAADAGESSVGSVAGCCGT